MVEPNKSNVFLHIVKTECGDRVVTKYKTAPCVGLIREFPKMQFDRKHREHIALPVRIHITAPKMDLYDLRIVKRRPIAEDACEPIALLDQRLRFAHHYTLRVRFDALVISADVSRHLPDDLPAAPETPSVGVTDW